MIKSAHTCVNFGYALVLTLIVTGLFFRLSQTQKPPYFNPVCYIAQPTNEDLAVAKDDIRRRVLLSRPLNATCVSSPDCVDVEYELKRESKQLIGKVKLNLTDDFFNSLKDQANTRCPQFPELRVAASLIVKNVEDTILDFLVHHILLGVEHFFIFDNGNTDDSVYIIQQFQWHGYVTLTHLDGCGQQPNSIRQGVEKARNASYDWLMLLDADERLIPFRDSCINSLIERLSALQHKVGSIRLSWMIAAHMDNIYGGAASLNCHHLDPLSQSFDNFFPLKWIKSIVNLHAPLKVSGITSAHELHVFDDWCRITTTGVCKRGSEAPVIGNDAFILHLQTRSFYEWIGKRKAGSTFTCCTKGSNAYLCTGQRLAYEKLFAEWQMRDEQKMFRYEDKDRKRLSRHISDMMLAKEAIYQSSTVYDPTRLSSQIQGMDFEYMLIQKRN